MKIVLWMLACIPGVVILAVVALQFPGVQYYIAQKALASISEKTHSRIEVGSVKIAFTHSVVLQNIFVESRQRDTLLCIQTLAADVNLLGLFSHDIVLHNVRIDSLTAHVTRTLPDSSFNFDFILQALSPDANAAGSPDTSSGPGWEIRLGGLSLNGIHVTYDDEVSGLNVRLQLGTLEATIDKCDLEKKQFHVDEFSLENTTASVIQTKASPQNESQSADVEFGIRTISLANVHLNYENKVAGDRYGVDLGTATLLAEKIDLPSHHIVLKSFLLENSNIAILQPPKKKNTTRRPDDTVVPWVMQPRSPDSQRQHGTL